MRRCRFAASGLEIGYPDYPLASAGISQDAAELERRRRGRGRNIRRGCNGGCIAEAAVAARRGRRGSFI